MTMETTAIQRSNAKARFAASRLRESGFAGLGRGQVAISTRPADEQAGASRQHRGGHYEPDVQADTPIGVNGHSLCLAAPLVSLVAALAKAAAGGLTLWREAHNTGIPRRLLGCAQLGRRL